VPYLPTVNDEVGFREGLSFAARSDLMPGGFTLDILGAAGKCPQSVAWRSRSADRCSAAARPTGTDPCSRCIRPSSKLVSPWTSISSHASEHHC
jgi:hypothetical protein